MNNGGPDVNNRGSDSRGKKGLKMVDPMLKKKRLVMVDPNLGTKRLIMENQILKTKRLIIEDPILGKKGLIMEGSGKEKFKMVNPILGVKK